MGNYFVEVVLEDVVCRDAESIHSSDKFALSGAVFTDIDTGGFALPSLRINSRETRSLGQLLFRGFAVSPKVALSLQGWDIDDNESWVENRDQIDAVARGIAQGVRLIPNYGLVAGTVLDGAREVVVRVVDQFVDWDKDDTLINYTAWQDLPPAAPHVTAVRRFAVDAKRSDPLGYSSFDYSLNLSIRARSIPSLWPPAPPANASDEAMRAFHHRGALAGRLGFAGAFPNFYYAVRNRVEYGGTIFLRGEACEWRDVPVGVLGNPNPRDFGARMRATQDYAVREGFCGGFPTFHQADVGGTTVFGTFLLRHAYATWRDVPVAELGNPRLDDIGARFRGTQDYASRNGFVGGLPTFYHAEHGGTLVCGTILLAASGAEWRDVYVRTIPG